MTTLRYIDDDIVRVYKFGKPRKKENLLATLFWGDSVKVVKKEANMWKLDFTKRIWNQDEKKYEWKKLEGAIPAKAKFREDPILKVRFVDVGQGDAAMIESPQGKLVLLDGGEGDHLRRYISAAWAHVLRSKPINCEAIVATHGDADHFAGLTKVLKATRGHNKPMVEVSRVFHSGLVKAPTSVGTTKIFGKSIKKNNQRYAVELEDDLRNVPKSRLNKFFKPWKEVLIAVTAHNPNLLVRRISSGDENAFDFLKNEGINIQVLGPIIEDVNGKPALPYLHGESSSSYSASHTINGHSIILKLTFGNVRVLFGADLNAESEAGLLKKIHAENQSISSEILKVPHHGSHDFLPSMLEAVSPVVSVISSGDESESKEYIHPRAGLVGALGKYSRSDVEKPLLYVTEMVAFFDHVGHVRMHDVTKSGKESKNYTETANAYIKKIFGIVHVRTDGKRVLVATHSGKPGQKESYAFHVDDLGCITFEEKTKVI